MINKEKIDQIHKDVPPDYYDKGIQDNIFQRYWHLKKFGVIKDMLGLVNGKILDVGCHSGTLSNRIAEYSNSKVIGIDISPPAINYAKERFKNLDFICLDIENGLPFGKNSFDVVTTFDILEHLLDLEFFINEAKRVLKNKGFFMIAIPNENILWKIVWFFWTKQKGKVWREVHIHHFSRGDFKKMIEERGFKKIDERFIHLRMYWLIKYQLSK